MFAVWTELYFQKPLHETHEPQPENRDKYLKGAAATNRRRQKVSTNKLTMTK